MELKNFSNNFYKHHLYIFLIILAFLTLLTASCSNKHQATASNTVKTTDNGTGIINPTLPNWQNRSDKNPNGENPYNKDDNASTFRLDHHLQINDANIFYSHSEEKELAENIAKLIYEHNINSNDLSISIKFTPIDAIPASTFTDNTEPDSANDKSNDKIEEHVLAINPDKHHLTASTVKLPLAIIILEEIFQSKHSLDEKLTYTSEDYDGGSGTIISNDFGVTFSLKELLHRLIVDSDNIAGKMLGRWFFSNTGEKAIIAIEKKFSINYIGNMSFANTPDMIKVMQYFLANPQNNPYFTDLKYLLNDRRGKTFIGENYDPKTIFFHKYGYYDYTYGEIAYIAGSKNTFIAVYLHDSTKNEKNSLAFLNKLGELIYIHSIF